MVQLVELTGNQGERVMVNPDRIAAIIDETGKYRTILIGEDMCLNVKESMDDIITAIRLNNVTGGVWYARDGGQEHRD